MADAPEEKAKRQADQRQVARALGVLVVIGFAIAFVAQNAQSVKVQFWFVSARPRLIYVIVGCLVVGAAFGIVTTRMRQRRQARRRSHS